VLRGGRERRPKRPEVPPLPAAAELEPAGRAGGEEDERDDEAADEGRTTAARRGQIERQVHLDDSGGTKRGAS
jgi:hypothetical protein